MNDLFTLSKDQLQEQIYNTALSVIDKCNIYITTRSIRSEFFRKMGYNFKSKEFGIEWFKKRVNNNIKVVVMLLVENKKLESAEKKGVYKKRKI